MTTQDTAPAEPEQQHHTRRYKPGDEITLTTEHGPRHGRITGYCPDEQHSYAVQVNIPEDEITLRDTP